jgi:hypothetical protein
LLPEPLFLFGQLQLLHQLGEELREFLFQTGHSLLDWVFNWMFFFFEGVRFFESSIFELLVELLNALVGIQKFALSCHEG